MPRGDNAGAPLGNKNALKLRDPEVRQLAYQKYCAHLAKGKMKQSFVFRHEQLICTWETIDKYLEDEIEFPPLKKRAAIAEGLGIWEQEVEDAAIGVNEKASIPGLQMLMRNKFGWDKEDKSKQAEIAPAAEKAANSMISMIQTEQQKHQSNASE